MPIYEYVCQNCGQVFEMFFRSMHRIPTGIECPACQSMTVQRLVSAPVVRTAGMDKGDDAKEVSPTEPAVFGRKELEAAQAKKRQLRDQADYEAKKK